MWNGFCDFTTEFPETPRCPQEITNTGCVPNHSKNMKGVDSQFNKKEYQENEGPSISSQPFWMAAKGHECVSLTAPGLVYVWNIQTESWPFCSDHFNLSCNLEA